MEETLSRTRLRLGVVMLKPFRHDLLRCYPRHLVFPGFLINLTPPSSEEPSVFGHVLTPLVNDLSPPPQLTVQNDACCRFSEIPLWGTGLINIRTGWRSERKKVNMHLQPEVDSWVPTAFGLRCLCNFDKWDRKFLWKSLWLLIEASPLSLRIWLQFLPIQCRKNGTPRFLLPANKPPTTC